VAGHKALFFEAFIVRDLLEASDQWAVENRPELGERGLDLGDSLQAALVFEGGEVEVVFVVKVDEAAGQVVFDEVEVLAMMHCPVQVLKKG